MCIASQLDYYISIDYTILIIKLKFIIIQVILSILYNAQIQILSSQLAIHRHIHKEKCLDMKLEKFQCTNVVLNWSYWLSLCLLSFKSSWPEQTFYILDAQEIQALWFITSHVVCSTNFERIRIQENALDIITN